MQNKTRFLRIFTPFWIILALLSFTVLSPESFGICSSGDTQCLYSFLDASYIAVPVFLFSLALLFLSGILVFVRDEVFGSWHKFFIIWVGISLVAFFLAPRYDIGSLSPLHIASDKETVGVWMASLFLILSLILIAWKSWRLRGKQRVGNMV